MPNKINSETENKAAILSSEDLKAVNGGTDDEITVKIKTLDGENDEYQVSPSSAINSLIDKYKKDKLPL